MYEENVNCVNILLLSKIMTFKINRKGPANLVPAAAVKRGDQVLGIITGHKEQTDGALEHLKKVFLNRYTFY